MSVTSYWIIVFIMAGVTLLSRTLPFLLHDKSRIFEKLCGEQSRLSVLGPAMLAAIAASTIVPGFMKTVNSGAMAEMAAYCLALGVVIPVLRISRNSGFAVISAMIFYACIRSFV